MDGDKRRAPINQNTGITWTKAMDVARDGAQLETGVFLTDHY
jgi:hypothetical protein